MFNINYKINNNSNVYSDDLNRSVTVDGSIEEVNHLVNNGYLVIKNLFDEDQLNKFKAALARVVNLELNDPNTELLENGHYIRHLLDKDRDFHPLIEMKKPLSISRAVLGPQVWFDAEARVVAANIEGLSVNWHIHHRVIPNPLPPMFCYPHAIHGILYLDDIDSDTGQICILPGSHKNHTLNIVDGGNDHDQKNVVTLKIKAGTCLLLHANLWHKTTPTTKNAKQRRLILFGYTPSWIKPDVARGVKVKKTLTDALKENGSKELRELLGDFNW
nr:phytanoyl-CoA dioxygenase family protein [uncultured Pedobacter sp.]